MERVPEDEVERFASRVLKRLRDRWAEGQARADAARRRSDLNAYRIARAQMGSIAMCSMALIHELQGEVGTIPEPLADPLSSLRWRCGYRMPGATGNRLPERIHA